MLSSLLSRYAATCARPVAASPFWAVALTGAGLIVGILSTAALVLWQIRAGNSEGAAGSLGVLATLAVLAVLVLLVLLARQVQEREDQRAAGQMQAAALAAEKLMLEAVAGSSSRQILETICHAVEMQVPDAICSILLLDEERLHLRHGAAPGLPNDYNSIIDGIAIGPNVGSCGTAAYFDRRVIVTDIMSDPLWAEYRAVAAQYGLRACWSTPIHSVAGQVLGTFAIYYREPRAPSPADLGWAERATHLAGIAIERQRAERAMAVARDEAERANRAKSVFLANMSHELRTPLNAIIGFSEGLGAGYFGALSETQHAYIRDICEAGKHLLSLINDLLDLSRIDAGKLQLDEETVELEPILSVCSRSLSAAAKQAGVEVMVDLPRRLPRLRADVTRVRQIVTNLLSNGIKFSPAGARVRVRSVVRTDGRLEIAIADDGPGMTSSEIDVALEPFRQVDGSHARRYTGSGLGLPLAKQLIELHGGSLEIESVPGTGTTVRAVFPASRVWPVLAAAPLPLQSSA